MQMDVHDLCGQSELETAAFRIKPFVEEVMNLGFDELPDYSHLRFLL